VPLPGLSTKPPQHPQTPYTKSMKELQSRCISIASALAAEINGDLSYVPEEDAERILARLTPDNVQETAEELAQLAYWFN
jgi:hypothetical protein